jgi:hypothetical protein
MTTLIDIRLDGFAPKEIEVLEELGAEFTLGTKENIVKLPLGSVAAILSVEANLTDLMTPPLCFNCGKETLALMTKAVWEPEAGLSELRHECPRCGSLEVTTRQVSEK